MCSYHSELWVNNGQPAPEPEKRGPGRPKGSGTQAKKLSDDQRGEIIKKHAAGIKVTELAREFGVAHSSIRYVLGIRKDQQPS